MPDRWSGSCLTGLLWCVAVVPLPAQDAAVRGVVRYRGPEPGLRRVAVTTDREVCGESILDRRLLMVGDKVRHAVVYLEGMRGATAPAVPVPAVTLTNRKCDFDPPVAASRAGATLTVRNDDPIFHNTHLYLDGRTVANVALPVSAVAPNRRALSRPGRIEVKCDAHPWMQAAMWVFDHAYFAVTDSTGGFEIRGVPPGRYTLRAWHPVLGEQAQEVILQAGPPVAIEFSFSKPTAANGAASGPPARPRPTPKS